LILILFLVLVLGYLAAFLGAERRKDARVLGAWWIACLAVAIAASGILMYILFATGPAKGGVEMAWIGIGTRRGEDALAVGGSRHQAGVGWPNGAFSPTISLRSSGGNAATINVQGGGGFVHAPSGFLNGTPLPENTKTQVGPYSLDVGSLPWRICFLCKVGVKISDAAGTEVASLDLRAGSEPRVTSIYSNLTVAIARLRKTDAVGAAALEAWADNLRLLVSRSEVRILNPASEPVSADLELPVHLTVYWPAQSQPVELKAAGDGRLEATFLPPWRLASPLPEPSADGGTYLTVESSALPGDYAFLVPFGGDLRGFNQTISLKGTTFTRQDRERPEFRNIVSEDTVHAGNYDLRFASVHDLPSWIRVLAALLIALAVFGFGLWLASARMRWRDGWALGGILTSVWVLLCIRLLLAFRYAIDPAHFDKFAFDGVASAMRALCVVPALILLAVRLRRDRAAQFHFESAMDRASAGKRLLAYMACVTAAVGMLTWISHSLWPNLEARYAHFSLGLGDLFTTVLIVAGVLWIAGYIFFLYFYDPEREATERVRQMLEDLRGRVQRRIVETFALDQSEGFWRYLGATLDDEDELDRQDYKTRLKALFAVLLALGVAAAVIGIVTRFAGANQKFLQEVAAPFLLCWMPATVWLAARLRFRPGSRMSRRSLSWLLPWLGAAVLLLLAPVILFPVALGDAGGIVAAFAFFWPAVALLAAGGRPRRLQWLPMGVLVFALVGAAVVYLNINYVTRLPGEARVRLLVFKEGANLQDRLLGSPMLKEDAANAPTFRQVSQGLQHTWENKAIAHEGGWFGLGFDRAPTRRSQVPQHTLQVDSTYSFYIASEYGLVGGFTLLLIYAMPLVWVLISARPRFDTGHGLATLITSAFVLEAIIHAGMNLTAFPYTGRDLPLLAVGSFTDLVRWTLLFCLATRALQWRALGSDEGLEGFRTESIISPPALPGASESLREPVSNYRNAVIFVGILPVFLLGWTVVKGVQIVSDPDLSRPFQWTRLLAAVRQAGDQGKLTVDPASMTIQVADESLAQEGGTLMEQEIARFNALTESEKLEGLGGHAQEFRKRLRQVRTISDYDRLLGWLRSVDQDEPHEERPLLFRLVPDPRSIDEEGRIPVAGRSFRILPNPAFNTSVSFHELEKDDIPSVTLRGQASGTFVIRGTNFEFHVPNMATRVTDDRTVVLEEGLNGSFRKISDSNPESADARIQIRYKAEKRARPNFAFGELRVASTGITFRPTVDAKLVHTGSLPRKLPKFVLQHLMPGDHVEVAYAIGKNKVQPAFTIEKSAQGALIGPAWVMGNWVPEYDPDPLIPWTASLASALPDEQVRLKKDLPQRFGTLTFDKTIQQNLQTFATVKGREHYQEYLKTGHASRDPLPPRVAIAVVSLPRGEVLGMGGWPRMNSSHEWEAGPGGDLIPPFTWVDRDAPHSLRLRYQSDRNFDRIAVGSASKPLWASAVLRLRRGLENKLAVRGSDEEESDVFGINISDKAWAVHPSDWRMLAKYLTVSDNRYQVRLGFLGLAKSDPDRPSDIVAGEASPSTKESLDGGKTPWAHFPAFEDIDFIPSNPTQIRGLEQSKLAERLKSMFGIGIETGEIAHRRSFWTGDEQNDWDSSGKAPLSQALEYTSPEAPNFELNRINSPRLFVNLLLGGGTNLWSNVDFAGAFGTCVLGIPITPHVTHIDTALIKPTKERAEGFDNPAAFYEGLKGVIDSADGTANPYLRGHALAVLNNMNGVQHYAKTGTLGAEEGVGNVSRINLALVKGDKKSGQTGLVISVVVEHAPLGTATQWLGEFLEQNEQDLRRLLGLR
jgi:cell division protein FtsW (lipid II flippase)